MVKFYHIHRGTMPSTIEQLFISNHLLFFSKKNSDWYNIEKEIGLDNYGGYITYEIDIPQKFFTNSLHPKGNHKILKINRNNIHKYKLFRKNNPFPIESLKENNIIGIDLTDEKIWKFLSTKPIFLLNSLEGCLWNISDEIKIQKIETIKSWN